MRLKDASILIVDDEPLLSEIIGEWFDGLVRKTGYASDGLQAQKMLASHEVDLIISDVRMPVMDGIRMLREIKTSGDRVPAIIFISGFSDIDPHEAYDLGAFALFEKPIEMEELIRAAQGSLAEREERPNIPTPVTHSLMRAKDRPVAGKKTPKDWGEIVDRIKAGDREAAAILYDDMEGGARFFLKRHLNDSTDVEDKVHDLFLIVVEAIRRGELRDKERLMGFVRTILYRQLNLEISLLIRKRETSADISAIASLAANEPDPEQRAAAGEKAALMQQLLRKMRGKDREILMRFYLEEQSPERIQREMGISKRQFDLLKTRAKARLQSAVQSKIDERAQRSVHYDDDRFGFRR